MFSILLQIPEHERDRVIAELWDQGTTGLVEHADNTEAFFEYTADREILASRFAQWSPRFIEQADTDWVRRIEQSFPPLLIGERLFLVPPWNTDPVPPNRLRLEINPGLACGTGWHPCTQMCLEVLEQTIRPGGRVLDVGTGSGILVVAALLLGAGVAVGCDIDEDAIKVARCRVQTPLFVGSAQAVASGSFDIAVANISQNATSELFADFERIAPRLILSGFETAPDLPRPPRERMERDGWTCIIY